MCQWSRARIPPNIFCSTRIHDFNIVLFLRKIAPGKSSDALYSLRVVCSESTRCGL